MAQRNNILWPLILIALMVLVVFSALAAPASRPATVPVLQYPYPAQQATNTPTATDTPTATSTATVAAATTTAATTTTATASPTSELPSPTGTATATSVPRGDAPSLTPTPTLAPDVEVLACAYGVPLFIEGEDAPPQTPLLLFFDDRAVGGDTSDSEGRYRLRLVPGEERPGLYPISVRVRDTRDIVDRLACEVVGATPTPTELVVTPTVTPES
jgi:hypothetical protein